MNDRRDDERREVSAADDTGMFANQELIAAAETLPVEDLHGALPDEHPAHAAIDDLHAAVREPKPDARAIERHVGSLRRVPELEATLANWWDAPATQRFISYIGQIGL